VADDAVPLRAMLVEGARGWGLDHPVETGRVFSTWKELVGEQVAARCEPAGLAHGVLKVWAATPAWAAELRYLAPEVIRRVNAGVGAPVVREVKVALPPAPVGRGGGAAPGSQRGRKRGRHETATGTEGTTGSEAAPRLRTRPSGAGLDPDALVVGITDDRLAAATKRALLAAKTHPERG
jgi:hypothetical protein